MKLIRLFATLISALLLPGCSGLAAANDNQDMPDFYWMNDDDVKRAGLDKINWQSIDPADPLVSELREILSSSN